MDTTIKTQPTIFVIFGATGDLTGRKVVPALYNLFLDGWLPKQFAIVGAALDKLSDNQFRETLLKDIDRFSRSGKSKKGEWDEFSKNIFYQESEINDIASYQEIGERIEKHNAEWGTTANVIFYMAVSPDFFNTIAANLSKSKLAKDPERTRIVIEKPFGHDLESARKLNQLLSGFFDERQVFRIDHFLGKETVQNIMAFRFANTILEPVWNRNYIEHVQISVTEQLGVEHRGAYYDGAGAMRDMIQNHLLQLLCLIAMEAPINFNADEVRNRKVDVLHAMRKFTPEDVHTMAVRGQYGKGWMEGERVSGYREEPDVDPDSNTETFAAIKFFVDNSRWHDVPFYLRTGKRMQQATSVITIQFKNVPQPIFPLETKERWQQNRLIISIAPEMGIRLQVQAKQPGLNMILNTVDMVFDYKNTYSNPAPKAYETLLLDTMLDDQTLFMRDDQVEAAWELLMPILNAWKDNKDMEFPNYAAGSWGPGKAETLIARDGYCWFSLPVNNKKSGL
jgi:glucose-6-phosphate 1-dehydrogenase